MTGQRRLLRIGLGVWLVTALGLLNWKLAGWPIDISPIEAESTGPPAQPSAGEPPPRAAPQSLAAYAETVSRPLFHPTRRPVAVSALAVPPAAAVAPSPPAEPPAIPASRLSLAGLMGTGAKSRRALIRAEGQPYGTWVEVGAEIDGWRLKSIEDNRVLIEKGGGREELRLHAPAPGR